LHDGAVLQEATVSEEQWFANQSPACETGREISAGTINSTPLMGGFNAPPQNRLAGNRGFSVFDHAFLPGVHRPRH
jgi:hypothetical protein